MLRKLALLALCPILLLTACGGRRVSSSSTPTLSPPPVPTSTPPAGPGSVEPLADGGVCLTTGDGLSLTLDAQGRAVALTVEGQDVPIAPNWPLQVRDLTRAAAPDLPNRLPNAGFEEGDQGWKTLRAAKVTIEVTTEAAHSGNHALAIRSQGTEGQGAVASPPLPVTPGKRYRLAGYFKIEFGYVDESGNPTFWQEGLYRGDRPISGLYLQWLDASGAPLGESPLPAVPLHWNAQDWHRLSREVTAPAGAAAAQVIIGARPITGAVWADDLSWVESPEADQPLTGTLEIASDHVTQTGEVDGLQVQVTYRPAGDHIAITTTVSDPTGGPRALDVGWGLPLVLTSPGATGGTAWRWWDGLRENRPLAADQDFARAVSADITSYLPISLYPYSVIENGTTAIALGIPLDSPRYMLLHYDGWRDRYEGRAHLGVSPLATKLNGQADFTLLLYRSDPAWGLRAAAARHAAIGPDWYDTPADFSPYEDYVRDHFPDTEPGRQRLKTYNEQHIYAAQYSVFETPVSMEEKSASAPTYAAALAFLQSLAEANAPQGTYPASVVCDAAGEPHLKSIGVFPWSRGKWTAIWIPNMDPDLPDGFGAARLEELHRLFTTTAQQGLLLNGVFVDNFISTTTIDLCPDHLAVADLPLTYTPNTYQSGVHVASAGWEYLTQLRALLDAQPEPYRSIVVNFWGMGIPNLLSPYLDAFGSEGDTTRAGNNWELSILDYRRATAMGRPRLFANQASNLSASEVKAFAHEALFYGTWGSQGPNAQGWPASAAKTLTWLNEQVKPLILLGWQPIPYATIDHADVWVERFGNHAFTVHNWGDKPADFTLTIDLTALGIDPAGLHITESVSGTTVEGTVTAAGLLEIHGHLDASHTAVYWIGK